MKRDRRRATAVQQVVEQVMDQKPAQSRAPDLWIATGLLVATLAVYAQVHAFDFINYDDPDYVSANAHVRGGLTPQNIAWAFTSTEDANWLPLTRLSHLVAGQMFGMWAGGHHLINMALHAASALLLFAWVRRVAGVRWPAAFVAFVFAIHPLHVESVAWVAERKDVLSGLFSMLTLWAYLSYLDRPNGIRYAGLLALFACGLMSKPMLVTLPAVLLLVDYWRERPFSKTVIIEKIPLFALSAASAAITYMVQQRAGAVSSLAQIPPGSRIANALVSGCIYV
ncbi:MAG TPA: hypothetical protein VK419_17460 [Bryobacteraceae bacterium]|nr:hypothetical protein [Bryobacteraceae bacterium]